MLRLMLAIFAWPLIVALLATAVLWYRAEFPDRPDDRLLDPIQLRAARQTAEEALDRLRALPSAEQERFITKLRAALQPSNAWIDALQAADYRILCLGEQHEPSTRRFLARQVFSHIAVDTLLIEATPEDVARIERGLDGGRDYVPLLDADIGSVLQAVHRNNPHVEIRGIEETMAQARARAGREGSRDRSLVRNFWRAWKPGARNVILYGAMHCAHEGTWLYHVLREQVPPREDVPMRNVRILGTGQHWPTRAFVYFVQALGLGYRDFVISDTAAVPKQVARWFPFFGQEVLSRYETLVVFHNTPTEIASSAQVRKNIKPVSKAPGSEDVLPQWVPAP